MSSIVIAGDTSGSVTLQAPATAGTTVLTLPSTSGTLAIGSGALVLLSTVTASNSATVDIETTLNSTYTKYLITWDSVVMAVNTDSLNVRYKVAATYVTTATYSYQFERSTSATPDDTVKTTTATAATSIVIHADAGNGAGESMKGIMWLSDPASTTLTKDIVWDGVGQDNNVPRKAAGVGLNSGVGAVTGIRFFGPNGNITSGTFRLYGIANS